MFTQEYFISNLLNLKLIIGSKSLKLQFNSNPLLLRCLHYERCHPEN